MAMPFLVLAPAHPAGRGEPDLGAVTAVSESLIYMMIVAIFPQCRTLGQSGGVPRSFQLSYVLCFLQECLGTHVYARTPTSVCLSQKIILGPHYSTLIMSFGQATLINLQKSRVEYLSLPFQMVSILIFSNYFVITVKCGDMWSL